MRIQSHEMYTLVRKFSELTASFEDPSDFETEGFILRNLILTYEDGEKHETDPARIIIQNFADAVQELRKLSKDVSGLTQRQLKKDFTALAYYMNEYFIQIAIYHGYLEKPGSPTLKEIRNMVHRMCIMGHPQCLSLMAVARAEYEISFYEMNEENSVNNDQPTNGEDGPFGGDAFRWRGASHSGLTGMQFNVLQAIWNSPDKRLKSSEVGEKAWGDDETEDAVIRNHLTGINNFFKRNEVTLSCSFKNGYAKLNDYLINR